MHALLGLILGCVVALTASLGFAASPEKRIALVIGNTSYKHAPALPNPRNDAQDMAAVLRRLGFEVVDGLDLDQRGMAKALAQFARSVQEADAALVFYAGHGLQYQGQNFLVPVDAELKDDVSVYYETTKLDDVVVALNRARGVQILILDACRDNPLAARLKGSDGFRSQGLAKVGGRGMIVAYATQANDVAMDGVGRNSPFTGALLQEIEEPGVEVGELFRRVAARVNAQTQGRQTPELSLSHFREFYLNPGETDEKAWARIRNSSDRSELLGFMSRFPKSQLVDAARARLDFMELTQKIAEQERLAREQERKRQEEARLVAEAAERQKADQKARELARLEDERKAAEMAARQKAEREAARQEEARKAEQERQQLEARRVAEIAEQLKAEQERLAREQERKRQEEARLVAEAAERQKADQKARELARLEDERKAAEMAARQKAEREASAEPLSCVGCLADRNEGLNQIASQVKAALLTPEVKLPPEGPVLATMLQPRPVSPSNNQLSPAAWETTASLGPEPAMEAPVVSQDKLEAGAPISPNSFDRPETEDRATNPPASTDDGSLVVARRPDDATPDNPAGLAAALGVTREVQERLRALGCYSGEFEPIWGEKSKTALQNFFRSTGLTPPPAPVTRTVSLDRDLPDSTILDLLRLHEGRACPPELKLKSPTRSLQPPGRRAGRPDGGTMQPRDKASKEVRPSPLVKLPTYDKPSAAKQREKSVVRAPQPSPAAPAPSRTFGPAEIGAARLMNRM
ncbi:caspase family protein [Microvirga massiliensis]|uniref:caspase family protein n=1 Tax=Microvirga massiliensis TaxID=1033741 RepID=UPI00062BE5D2|nr:caspase domain-containing protein [Microvirga massiliensis]